MQRIDNQATPDRSVLTLLRGLVPRRDLTPSETYRIAELQANRLLGHFDIRSDAVPAEIITELPRIRIEFEPYLPVSGAAHWNGRYWVIALCAEDHPLRQRFSLMHEFKHIIDHTTRERLYHDRAGMNAQQQAERVADYFAACVLMPKRVVKRLWGERQQDIEGLARTLQVSPAALRYRLNQIGLTERAPRCARPLPSPQAARLSLVGGRQ